MSLFFFLKKEKKGEWWNYTVKQQPQIWAKMEYNLFCEIFISNKLGKKEIMNVFENIKLCYQVLNYLLEIVRDSRYAVLLGFWVLYTLETECSSTVLCIKVFLFFFFFFSLIHPTQTLKIIFTLKLFAVQQVILRGMFLLLFYESIKKFYKTILNKSMFNKA